MNADQMQVKEYELSKVDPSTALVTYACLRCRLETAWVRVPAHDLRCPWQCPTCSKGSEQ